MAGCVVVRKLQKCTQHPRSINSLKKQRIYECCALFQFSESSGVTFRLDSKVWWNPKFSVGPLSSSV